MNKPKCPQCGKNMKKGMANIWLCKDCKVTKKWLKEWN